MSILQTAAQYVRNTNGGATKAHFVEDHEPIGERLWADLQAAGAIEVRDDRIYLTTAGEALADTK